MPLNQKGGKKFFNLQAFIYLFMWLQLLNMLRASRPLAAMIYGINAIIGSIQSFLILLLVAVCAFAATVTSLAENYTESDTKRDTESDT